MSDVKLAGVIAQHDGVAEELVRLNAAPQRPLGGDLNGVGCHVQPGQAEPVEVGQPRLPISEVGLWVSHQAADQRRRQGMLAHIAVGRLVEHVIGMAGTEQFKEVQPAFGCACAKPGEPVIADLRAKAVLGLVPRTGVVDRDIRRCLQPRPQNILRFRDETCLIPVQQADQMPFRDRNPKRSQKIGSSLFGVGGNDPVGLLEAGWSNPP